MRRKLKAIQKELNERKWYLSEKYDADMSGQMDYCLHCKHCFFVAADGHICSAKSCQELIDKECICARAYVKMRKRAGGVFKP